MANILLICADQMRGDCLSARAHPTVKTPVLDALAAEGTLFENHYTVAVPCGPARASLVTGQYLFNHRSVFNGVPLSAQHTTLAQAATAHGLDCLLFGYTDTTPDPVGMPPQASVFRHYQGVAAGFHPMALWRNDFYEDWLAYLAGRGYDFSDDFAAVFPPSAADSNPRPFTNAPAPYRAEDSDTAYLSDLCINYLRANGKRRDWLIMLGYYRPHPPLIAPVPFNDMYPDPPLPPRRETVADEMQQHPYLAAVLDRQNAAGVYQHGLALADGDDSQTRLMRGVYYGLVSELDHHIGRVLDCLRETGLDEKTLVIFTSDHADTLGEHWSWGKRGYFDSAYHVPLIVRPPQRAAAGRRVQAFTESVDIMPTILDWLGSEIPSSVDGRSVLPFLGGETPEHWRQEAFFECDYRYGEINFGTDLPAEARAFQILRGAQYKYIHFGGGIVPLLFDCAADPHEFVNRAGEAVMRDVISDYRARLVELRLRHSPRLFADYLATMNGLRRL